MFAAEHNAGDPLSALRQPQPQSVWAHFITLCEIPRASLHEAALRDYLVEWAKARGIGAEVDAIGNLILRKPASAGCEAAPGIILQGHLDMVCQANAGAQHDFGRDPIRAVVRDGWVAADETTLGADNGIGVALALAALEDPELAHPPLEVLLTVNEESGMDGARGLAADTLRGRALINLDSEEWGHFYLGCAGGVDVEVRHVCLWEETPPDYVPFKFALGGLRGGHSGIDIHLGRGNAIKLLAEALRDLAAQHGMRLIEMQGGTARNAIPREATALLALPATQAKEMQAWAQEWQSRWRERLAQADADVTFTAETVAPAGKLPRSITYVERDRLLRFLCAAPNGVDHVSEDFPGVTDTSDNLGVLTLREDEFRATFKIRSLRDERANALVAMLLELAADCSLHAWRGGAYPGWTPDPASKLLALCQRVYAEQFGQPASVQVVHAGLECGLFAAGYPHLEMISFGPDIRGAHAPGERVEIASVARCWTLLKAILRALSEPPCR